MTSADRSTEDKHDAAFPQLDSKRCLTNETQIELCSINSHTNILSELTAGQRHLLFKDMKRFPLCPYSVKGLWPDERKDVHQYHLFSFFVNLLSFCQLKSERL